MGSRGCAALLLGVALWTGCSTDSEPRPGPADGLAPVTDSGIPVDSEPLPPAMPQPERPAQVTDTVMIEGMPQVETLRLARAPSTFTVPFSTYVPEGIAVEFDAEFEIEWVRFNAAFAGSVDERAYMIVRLYPAGTTALEVEDAVREYVTGLAPGMDASKSMDAPPWADWALRLSYPDAEDGTVLGSVAVGRHGPRFFEVLRLYPAEYGDGLGPRLGSILRHWRWEDTGRPLTG